MEQERVLITDDVLPRGHCTGPYLLSGIPFQPAIYKVAMPLDLLIFWFHAAEYSIRLGEKDSGRGIQFVGGEGIALLNHSEMFSPEA